MTLALALVSTASSAIASPTSRDHPSSFRGPHKLPEPTDTLPISQRKFRKLRKLGCTKEQVSRHLDQVTKSRTAPVSEKRNQNRQHKIDWP